jgi:hypothetical protein
MTGKETKEFLRLAKMITHFKQLEWLEKGQIRITRKCEFCSKDSIITCNKEGFFKWIKGELIQKALPTLSPGEREQLRSGYHETCYDKMSEMCRSDS